MNLLSALLMCLVCFSAAAEEITNGMTAGSQSKTLVFEEDLVIEGDGDDEHLWVGLDVSYDIRDDGHIFISDPGENRILQFAPDGKLADTHGRSGQAPGEFQGLSSFQFLADGSAVAFDAQQGIVRSVTFYDKNMKVLKRDNITAEIILLKAEFSPDGKYINALWSVADPKTNESVIRSGVLDREFKPLLTMSSNPKGFFDPNFLTDANYWVQYLSREFKFIYQPRGYVAFAGDGSILTALNQKYSITQYANDLKTVKRVITKEYKPIAQSEEQIYGLTAPIREMVYNQLPTELRSVVTENVIRKAITKAEFPPAKDPIAGLVCMEDGGFIVAHNLDKVTFAALGDVFGPDGKYQGSFSLRDNGLVNGNVPFHTRLKFKNGKAYTIHTNAEFANTFVRYSYTLK